MTTMQNIQDNRSIENGNNLLESGVTYLDQVIHEELTY